MILTYSIQYFYLKLELKSSFDLFSSRTRVLVCRALNILCCCCCYPFAQVAGEDEVAGEGVGEGRVEVQHFHQGVSADDVQVAVGQSSHVSACPRQCALFPEHVPEHVPFTCRGAESVSV